MVHSTCLPFGELLVFSFILFFLPVLLNTFESVCRKRLRTLTGDIFTKPEVSFSPSSLQLGLKPEEIKKSILLNSLEPGSLISPGPNIACAGHGNPTEGLLHGALRSCARGFHPKLHPPCSLDTCVCDCDHRLFFGVHVSWIQRLSCNGEGSGYAVQHNYHSFLGIQLKICF